MTTDPEEGNKQAEAAQPKPLSVGDRVRLSAGILPMQVVALEDYGNMVVCEWLDADGATLRDTFPVRSLEPV